ncbi:putative hotdog family 3-hydroxylacyl-ACP dehydratase [Mesonia hippocampi]|uniref:Putative hotdog family 3-hydroxylacyl-ACP dehydratase n=1 Tax=Mesonia hippocampi TaxID=1628250 RepID=A0A840EMV9_9FLAO|nr:ABC transporter permease [Mesonia hippocampi]MBB4117973.1 putative hotdog family 3-hydroxylacyl-ACP dehydratase [Mesonia hippocampi]
MKAISAIEIRNFLPHRAPMLMVDLITNISEDYVETTFCIPEDCIFIAKKRLAEAGLIENAAQTCAAIVAQNYFTPEKTDVKVIGFIGGIKKLIIKALPLANQTLVSKAKLISKMNTEDFTLCLIACEVFAENKLLLETQMNLFIKEQ